MKLEYIFVSYYNLIHDMYRSVNIDAAVEHLKNIVDSTRCAVCDKTDGTRMRYPCGHTSCGDCVVLGTDCLVCLTPPFQSDSRVVVVDEPFTQRAANALNLLNIFQNEFRLDVYKRQRISEQLKAEREVFPDCIQAPAKYINKRKSCKNSKSDKENRLSKLPGEVVSTVGNHKMEQQSENVEIWLNKYVRKPFAELNSNDQSLRMNTQAIKKQLTTNNKNLPLITSKRKRSHSKTKLKNETFTLDYLSSAKKTKTHNKKNEKICSKPDTSKFNNGVNINTTDNNESGIVMEDEAIIEIDDSQSLTVDKDLNAWLAVLEAERNKQYESTLTSIRSIDMIPLVDKAVEAKNPTQVPFYLKSHLSDKCIHYNCNQVPETIESNKNESETDPNKAVSITVENKHFITVIKIEQIDKTENKHCMQSVEVQTDLAEIIPNSENVDKHQETPSQKLFKDCKALENTNKVMNMNKTGNVIIAESDSESDLEESALLEVTAEIHRSCEEVDYGILADVDNLEEHGKRARRAPRGITPTSSNSSEKENYNPNRMKKLTTSKKKPMKK